MHFLVFAPSPSKDVDFAGNEIVKKVQDSGETIGRDLLDRSSEFTDRNSTPRRNLDVRKGWLGHGAANPTDQKALAISRATIL